MCWQKLHTGRGACPNVPVFESVEARDKKLMINVNASYATVAEREDELGKTSDISSQREALLFAL